MESLGSPLIMQNMVIFIHLFQIILLKCTKDDDDIVSLTLLCRWKNKRPLNDLGVDDALLKFIVSVVDPIYSFFQWIQGGSDPPPFRRKGMYTSISK